MVLGWNNSSWEKIKTFQMSGPGIVGAVFLQFVLDLCGTNKKNSLCLLVLTLASCRGKSLCFRAWRLPNKMKERWGEAVNATLAGTGDATDSLLFWSKRKMGIRKRSLCQSCSEPGCFLGCEKIHAIKLNWLAIATRAKQWAKKSCVNTFFFLA